jgi:hypothetical protein
MSQVPPDDPPPPGAPQPGYPPSGGQAPGHGWPGQPPSGPPGAWGPQGPWAPQPPPRRSTNRLPLILAGAAALVVVTLVAGALVVMSDDGGSGDGRDAYVEAISAQMEARGTPMSESERRCVAGHAVDVMGLENLQGEVSADELRSDLDTSLRDHGVAPDQQQATELFDRMGDCVDVRQIMGEALNATVGPEFAQCVLDAIDDTLLERLIVGNFIDGDAYLTADPELGRDFAAAVEPCEPS